MPKAIQSGQALSSSKKLISLVIAASLLACGGEDVDNNAGGGAVSAPESSSSVSTVSPSSVPVVVSSSSIPVISSSSSLGLTSSSASSVVSPNLRNLLSSSGTFDSGQEQFTLFSMGNIATVRWQNHVNFSISRTPTESWHVQLLHDISIESGKQYSICFDAKASANRSIIVDIDQGAPNYSSLSGAASNVDIETFYRSFKQTFTANDDDTGARLVFSLGLSDANVQLDNIGVYEGSDCPDSSSSNSVDSSTPAVSSSSAQSSSIVSVTPTSSSVSSVPSTSSSSANVQSSAPAGNAVSRGMALYEARCQVCHGVDGDIDNGARFKLDMRQFPNDAGLVAKIESMVPGQPTRICTGNCASDVAAYLRTWEVTIEPVACEAAPETSHGPRLLKVLTMEEYQSSIEVLLGVDRDYRSELIADNVFSHFANNSSTIVGDTSMTKYFNLAKVVAQWAVANNKPFDCGSNCASRFNNEFAYVAYRRDLSDDEKQAFNRLFRDAGAQGMEAAITAVLSSPNFLYRSEMGITADQALSRNIINRATRNELDSDSYVLTPFELATSLSFMYTGATPTKPLLDRAKNNRLNTNSQITNAIDDMIDSNRGKAHFGKFAGAWLGTDRVVDVEKDNARYPRLTQQVLNDMREEVRSSFKEVMYSNDLSYEDFFGGDFTMLNRRLADYYGINGVSGNNFRRVTNVGQRGGILTTGAFMVVNSNADESSPIKRAARVREFMLCHHFGPIPELVDARQDLIAMTAADRAAGLLTTRTYYERITDAPACNSCHLTGINPMFGMENFDHLGLFRDQEQTESGNVLPIDNSGQLIGVDTLADGRIIDFNGAKDFSAKLGQEDQPMRCLSQKGFRYLMGRGSNDTDIDNTRGESALSDQEQTDYACATERMVNALQGGNGDIKALFKVLGQQPLVKYRKNVNGR